MKKLFFSLVVFYIVFSLCAAEKGGALEDTLISVRDANEPPVKYEKGKAYLIEFDVCKKPKQDAKPQTDVSKTKTGLILHCSKDENNEYIEISEIGMKIPKNGKHRDIAEFGMQAPVDGQVHHVKAAFEIPEDADGVIWLGAVNGNHQVWLDVGKTVVTELPPQEKIVIGPAKVEQTVAGDNAGPKRPRDVVKINFGDDGVLTVFGDGMFRFANGDIPLERKTAYKVTCELRKEGAVSQNPAEHRLVIVLLTPQNRVQELCYIGEDVKPDGQWRKCQGTFTTTGAEGDFKYYIYNVYSTGTVQIRNLVFRRIENLMPWGEENVLAVKGTGKFLGKSFPIDLPAGKVCAVSLKMRKTAPLAEKSEFHRVVLSYQDKDNKNREILYLGDNVPVDSQWHDIKGTLKVPDDCNGTAKLNVYNCNATGLLEIQNWKVVEVK